jgi:hypothetical protein
MRLGAAMVIMMAADDIYGSDIRILLIVRRRTMIDLHVLSVHNRGPDVTLLRFQIGSYSYSTYTYSYLLLYVVVFFDVSDSLLCFFASTVLLVDRSRPQMQRSR